MKTYIAIVLAFLVFALVPLTAHSQVTSATADPSFKVLSGTTDNVFGVYTWAYTATKSPVVLLNLVVNILYPNNAGANKHIIIWSTSTSQGSNGNGSLKSGAVAFNWMQYIHGATTITYTANIYAFPGGVQTIADTGTVIAHVVSGN